jgi:hypothetical protein
MIEIEKQTPVPAGDLRSAIPFVPTFDCEKALKLAKEAATLLEPSRRLLRR